MIAEYVCENCGKHFYYHGEAAIALRNLVDLKGLLERNGFYHIPSAYRLVEIRAKCCEDPDIFTVLMRS